jgi:signal transduction histidine kinase
MDLLEAPVTHTVSAEARHHIFLAVKEALNNIVRHASATTVSLRAVVSEKSLALIIEDDGQGFDVAPDDPAADGLRNMRQRMEEIGGTFTVESKSGKGTRISLVYPWPKKKMASP